MREYIEKAMLSLMMIISIVACSSNEDIIPPTLSLLTLDESSLNDTSILFNAKGEQKSFQIKSNALWQIECEAEWVDLSPKAGSGNSQITISVDATDKSRSAVAIAYVSNAPQLRQVVNIIQSLTPQDTPQERPDDKPEDDTNNQPEDDTNNQPEDGTDDNPEKNPDDNVQEQPEDMPEDNPNDNPNEENKDENEGTNEDSDDNSQEQPNDTPSDQPEGTPDDSTDLPPSTTPDEPHDEYIEITTLSELSAGDYYMGGYQNDVLHLATEGISSGHIHTAPYAYSAESLLLTPQSEEEAIVVTLEQASDKNSYYIHFSNEGYLHATDAKPGELAFTSSPQKEWLFTPYDYGFLVVQQGAIEAKLICSEHAPDRLLRSMSCNMEEEGGAIVLLRKK